MTLRVYDITGRYVATIESTVRAAGSHQVIWDTKGLARGVYVCRLAAGGQSVSRRLLKTD